MLSLFVCWLKIRVMEVGKGKKITFCQQTKFFFFVIILQFDGSKYKPKEPRFRLKLMFIIKGSTENRLKNIF